MLEQVKGLTFPLRFSSKGKLDSATGQDKISDNLTAIVVTSVNQRVMRPTFGTPSEDLLFTKLLVSSTNAQEIRLDVISSIQEFEPRVTLESVSVEIDSNRSAYVIKIHYKLKGLGFQSVIPLTVTV